MNNKKIAFFITHPIQYLSPLFRKLSKNSSIDLTVYYFSDETVKDFKSKEMGQIIKWDVDLLGGHKYKFLKNNSLKPSISNMPFGLINFDIYKEIKEAKYDFIIIHGWNYISHWLVFIAAFMNNVPILLRAETPYNQELLKPKLKILLKKILLTPLFKKVSGFLSIGKQNKEFYKSYGIEEDKIYFAPYAVDNDYFSQKYLKLKPIKEKLKEKHNLIHFNKIILFVGKLIDKKRPMDLVKAFHMTQNEEHCLVFVGNGENRKEIEVYIKENNISNIFLVGFKNQSELPEFYAIADLFVLPSGLGETWGLVVNEAMNYGLPILVSETVGCSSDLINGNGFTFHEGDIKDMSKKINILLSDNKDINQRSLEIIKKYSYENIEKGILKAIFSEEKINQHEKK